MANRKRPRAKKPYRYILGDSSKESARLQRQADLWDPHAYELFERIGVRKGWKILEVGPGRGSLHLDLRRRVRGPIDAVERSPIFAEFLASQCSRDKLGHGKLWNCDLIEAPLPKDHYDFIFARWVFLFLPDPLDHIKQLVRALKPGGTLAIQDYLRDTLNLVPRPPEWDSFMQADRAFFASQGGDVNIGSKLPQLFNASGLRDIEVTPHLKFGRPGEPVWEWLSDYFLGVLKQYSQYKGFSIEHSRALRKSWRTAERDSESLLIAPTVLDVVGRKPKSARTL